MVKDKNSLFIIAIVAIVAIVAILLLFTSNRVVYRETSNSNIAGEAGVCGACVSAGCPGRCTQVCPQCGATPEDLKPDAS